MDFLYTVIEIVKGSPHFFVFLILFLCGLGLPIPEEVTLIAAAWSALQEWAPLQSMFAVSIAAILAGDLATYTVGRYVGYRLVRLPYFRRVLSEERLTRVDQFFDKYGDWAVFIARFFAGFRLGCYFIAGLTRLSVGMFLLMDFLAALLSVGLTFLIILSFGEQIEVAIQHLRQTQHAAVILVAVVVVAVVAWKIWRGRRARSPSEAKAISPKVPENAGN